MDFDLKYHKELNSLKNHMYQTLRGSGGGVSKQKSMTNVSPGETKVSQEPRMAPPPVPNQGETKVSQKKAHKRLMKKISKIPTAKKAENPHFKEADLPTIKGVKVPHGSIMRELFIDLKATLKVREKQLKENKNMGLMNRQRTKRIIEQLKKMVRLIQSDTEGSRFGSYNDFYDRINKEDRKLLQKRGWKDPSTYKYLVLDDKVDVPPVDGHLGIMTPVDIPLATIRREFDADGNETKTYEQ